MRSRLVMGKWDKALCVAIVELFNRLRAGYWSTQEATCIHLWSETGFRVHLLCSCLCCSVIDTALEQPTVLILTKVGLQH